MTGRDILEWLTTTSGLGAAIASACAAVFARQAAIAARTQIELQRPRPVVYWRTCFFISHGLLSNPSTSAEEMESTLLLSVVAKTVDVVEKVAD